MTVRKYGDGMSFKSLAQWAALDLVRSARLHGLLRAQGTAASGRALGTCRSTIASTVARDLRVTSLPTGKLCVHIARSGGSAHPRVRVRNAAKSVTYKTYSEDSGGFWACFGNTDADLLPTDEELVITADAINASISINRVIAWEGDKNDLPTGITGTVRDGD